MSQVRYTLKQLHYFTAAGEAGSIARAAQAINISQASISAAVAQLEEVFGVQLFVRHHAQGLSLTPAGKRLMREAKALIKQAEELQLTAGALAERVAGPLDIGCFVTLAPIIVPELCHSFTRAYEEVRVNVVEGDQLELLDRLNDATISVALTYDLDLPDHVAFEPLAELPPYVQLAGDHRLAARDHLTLLELAEEPLVLLDLPLSRQYFHSLFLVDALKPLVVARSAHPEVVRSLVAHGYGYGLANVRPRNTAALDGRPLAYVPLKGDYPPMTLGVATLKDVRHTRTMDAFIDHCRARVSDRDIPGMVAI